MIISNPKHDIWKDIPNFIPEEFACKHCLRKNKDHTFLWIDAAVIYKTQVIREAVWNKLGLPTIITSATRCINHPLVQHKLAHRGRAGAHYAGFAIDVKVTNKIHYNLIRHEAIAMGALGIGDGLNHPKGSFIHADWWPERTRFTAWDYGQHKPTNQSL